MMTEITGEEFTKVLSFGVRWPGTALDVCLFGCFDTPPAIPDSAVGSVSNLTGQVENLPYFAVDSRTVTATHPSQRFRGSSDDPKRCPAGISVVQRERTPPWHPSVRGCAHVPALVPTPYRTNPRSP